jgi:hypothetical protein
LHVAVKNRLPMRSLTYLTEVLQKEFVMTIGDRTIVALKGLVWFYRRVFVHVLAAFVLIFLVYLGGSKAIDASRRSAAAAAQQSHKEEIDRETKEAQKEQLLIQEAVDKALAEKGICAHPLPTASAVVPTTMPATMPTIMPTGTATGSKIVVPSPPAAPVAPEFKDAPCGRLETGPVSKGTAPTGKSAVVEIDPSAKEIMGVVLKDSAYQVIGPKDNPNAPDGAFPKDANGHVIGSKEYIDSLRFVSIPKDPKHDGKTRHVYIWTPDRTPKDPIELQTDEEIEQAFPQLDPKAGPNDRFVFSDSGKLKLVSTGEGAKGGLILNLADGTKYCENTFGSSSSPDIYDQEISLGNANGSVGFRVWKNGTSSYFFYPKCLEMKVSYFSRKELGYDN